jgi:hypothetical protein
MEIIFDLLTADAQQRTDNLAVFRADARQSMDATTSQQVHEEGLNGIVAMMGHTDGFCTNILTKLAKIAITELSGGHLNAYLM